MSGDTDMNPQDAIPGDAAVHALNLRDGARAYLPNCPSGGCAKLKR